MGNVHQVAAQPLHDRSKFEVSLHSRIGRQQGNGVKILWEWTNLFYLLRGANQEVGTLTILPAQGSNDVANISADTEFGHAADINRNLHGTSIRGVEN